MRRNVAVLVAVPLAVVLSACGDVPLAPAGDAGAVLGPAYHLSAREVRMLDVCDPASFNAAIGPGTCTNRNGGLTFDKFIAQLQRHGTVESWRFMPEVIHVPRTMTLDVANIGGETHTFTEVAAFGGGFVPFLNQLTGNLVPALECVNPIDPMLPNPALVFVPAGGHDHITFQPGVAKKYMCCIHPWMRAVSR